MPTDIPTTRDPRPQRFSWAPGGYIAECRHCGKRFIGDKRAHLCAPCAYNDEGMYALRVALEKLASEHYTHPDNWPEELKALLG